MNQQLQNRLRKISSQLKSQYQAEQVILFGSHARKRADQNSDIYLLIISPINQKFYQRMATVRGLIRDLRQGLPIAPIVLREKELQKRIKPGDRFVREILKPGIKLFKRILSTRRTGPRGIRPSGRVPQIFPGI